MKPYCRAAVPPRDRGVASTFNAVASTWASSFGDEAWLRFSKNDATRAFVLLVKLLTPALAPYRLGKVAASQFASAVELAPLKLLISAWPFLFCQKPIPADWPGWIFGCESSLVIVPVPVPVPIVALLGMDRPT